MDNEKYAVAYMRTNNDENIDIQKETIDEFCKENGLKLSAEYVDTNYTANDKDRPALQRMMTDAQKSPPWDTIIVSDFSRLSRDVRYTLECKIILEQHHISLLSVVECKMHRQKNLAVAYMRYSSDNQNENSITYQSARILNYCATKGITLVHQYIDRAYSGTNDKRPNFQKMIADAQNNPPWSKVLVFNLSRYFRNDSEALHYRDILNDNGIELISVTQEFADTPEGKLMESIIYSLDGYYSRSNALHTHSGMLEKAKRGLHCGGLPPLGYDVGADRKLVINPTEAEAVKLIFDMFEQNLPYSKIAEHLNNSGYRSKRGSLFNKYSFDCILRQEKYTGMYTWNKARSKNSKHKRNSHVQKPIEEQIGIVDGCPMIICPEQFDRVQSKLISRAHGNAKNKGKHHYMLTGLDILKCAECGNELVGGTKTSHGKTYVIYSCPNHRSHECCVKDIRAKYLDNLVAGMVAKSIYNTADVNCISDKLNCDDEQAALDTKLKRLDRSINNLVLAIEKNPSDELLKRLTSLQNQRSDILSELEGLEASSLSLTQDNMKDTCLKLKKLLKNSDSLDVKTFLKNNIINILVGNETITINLTA